MYATSKKIKLSTLTHGLVGDSLGAFHDVHEVGGSSFIPSEGIGGSSPARPLGFLHAFLLYFLLSVNLERHLMMFEWFANDWARSSIEYWVSFLPKRGIPDINKRVYTALRCGVQNAHQNRGKAVISWRSKTLTDRQGSFVSTWAFG